MPRHNWLVPENRWLVSVVFDDDYRKSPRIVAVDRILDYDEANWVRELHHF